MPGHIFYRERVKETEGRKQPRYKMIAVAGVDLRVFGKHLRRSELDQIAEKIGAELVLLSHGDKKYKQEDQGDEVEVNE
jgi:hypothetical protein